MCLAALLPVLLTSILLVSGTNATTSLLRQRHRQRRRPPQASLPSCTTSTCPDPVCTSPTCGGSTSQCGPNCTDILIIGAGAAGLGASREIEKYNQENPEDARTYKVIEEYSEAGGRMKEIHWIHGGEGNPFAEFLWEQGRRGCRELEYDVQKWTDVKYYKFVGSSVEEVSKRESNRLSGDFRDIYDCVIDKANEFWPLPYNETAPEDIGLGGALDECYTELNIDPNINLEWLRFDFDFSQRPNVTSMYGLPEDTYDCFQDRTDWFLSDPCYGPEELAKREFDHNCITECIEFNTTVIKVAWNATWPIVVEVESSDGSRNEYKAGQVISTVSVGVIDSNREMFEPPWEDVDTTKAGGGPSDKLADMNAVFQMGLYYEIAFKLGNNYWDNVDDNCQFINIDFRNSSVRGHGNWWQVYDTKWDNEFYQDSQVVVVTLTTEKVHELEVFDNNTKLDEVVSDLLRDSLGHVVGFTEGSANCTRCNGDDCDNFFNDQLPAEDECHYRFYDHTEISRYGGGSYENWQVGGERLQLENFQAPLISGVNGREVVQVAGSACCFNFWGYSHGAYYSGIRAGNAALKADGVDEAELPNSPQFCEESPTGGLGNLMLPRGGG